MSSKCGAYQITTATDRQGAARRGTDAEVRAREEDDAGRTEGDREVRQGPDPEHSRRPEARDGPCSSGPHRLECSDGHDAHRKEGEAVAARETRDVEEQRRRCGEGKEENSCESARADVEPRCDDDDTDDEGNRSPESECDSDSPKTELVAQPRRLKSSWLLGLYDPVRIVAGPVLTESTTVRISSQQ